MHADPKLIIIINNIMNNYILRLLCKIKQFSWVTSLNAIVNRMRDPVLTEILCHSLNYYHQST